MVKGFGCFDRGFDRAPPYPRAGGHFCPGFARFQSVSWAFLSPPPRQVSSGGAFSSLISIVFINILYYNAPPQAFGPSSCEKSLKSGLRATKMAVTSRFRTVCSVYAPIGTSAVQAPAKKANFLSPLAVIAA